MPKKPNSHGNDQEYVPAGNGDASGEYADEQGGNRHFENFGKKDDKGLIKTEIPTNTTNSEEQPSGEIEEKGDVAEPKTVSDERADIKKMLDSRIADTRLAEKSEEEIAKLVDSIYYHLDWDKIGIFGGNNIDKLYNKWSEQGVFDNLLRDDFDKMVELVRDADNVATNEQFYYESDGKMWNSFHPGIEMLTGKQLFNEEEKNARAAEIKAEQDKINIEKRDKLITKNDNEIKKSFGEKTVVAFGKGYTKDALAEITTATQIITSEFEGIKDFCREIGDKSVLNNYNDLNAKIQGKYFVKYKESQQTIAAYYPGRQALVYNGAVAKKQDEESAQRQYDVGFHASNKSIGTLYHEMGHMVDDMLEKVVKNEKDVAKRYDLEKFYSDFRREIYKLLDENVNYNVGEKFVEKYGRRYNAYQMGDYQKMADLKAELNSQYGRQYNISEYGNTNIKEFVAECFSAHYTGMNNELATKVVNMYKETYKKLKEQQ